MTHPPIALLAQAIAVERGERRVIDDLSFALGPGEAVAVTGPNGSGKSTLLRAVAGLIPLAAGAIAVQPAQGMHLVAHQNAIKLSLSAADNLAFWSAVLGGSADERSLEEALAALGLIAFAETPAEFLSQGQRRRLALARLLAAPRRIWLLDEPTAGLDAASRENFAGILRRHVGSGGIVLAATHDLLGLPVRELRLGDQAG